MPLLYASRIFTLPYTIDAEVGAILLKRLMSLQICDVAPESRIQFPDKRLADRAGLPIDKPLNDVIGKALCKKLLYAVIGKSLLGIDKPFYDITGKTLCKLLCATIGKSPKGEIEPLCKILYRLVSVTNTSIIGLALGCNLGWSL